MSSSKRVRITHDDGRAAPVIIECLASPDQQIMILAPQPIVVWVCGRRYGKTLCGRMKMLKAGTDNPGCQVWYVAAIYRKRILYQFFDIDDKPELFMPLWRLCAVHHFTLPIK